jgi:cholest-4-en-3-one 26-monooxygenase
MAIRLEDVELFDPDAYAGGVPHEMFALLRRESPVHRHPQPGASPYWAVTRYRDIVAVSRDWATFSSERRGAVLGEPPEEVLATQRLMMLNMDPPRHSKLRALVKSAAGASS